MSERDQRVTEIVTVLNVHGLGQLPQDCGRQSTAGVDEVEAWREWSHRPPTADQQRIERRLCDFLGPGDKLLHIGVGGSDLALRFAPRVRSVVGMTISKQEKRHADAVGLPNYQVLIWNKYQYWPNMPAAFDAIVDNNPTTFACCLRHVAEMFTWYADSLSPTGAIFTDRVGLGWVVSGGDKRWGLDLRRLTAVAGVLGLVVVDIDGDVYGVTAPHGIGRLQRLRRRRVLSAINRAASDPTLFAQRLRRAVRGGLRRP